MIVVDPSKGFVNPTRLARLSLPAGSRYRSGLAAVIPQIVRPELLSDQMRGCGCGMCGGAAEPGIGRSIQTRTTFYPVPGLGQLPGVDPTTAAITGISQALAQAKALYTSLLTALGIGAGAREANIIVPIQNQITNNVLVPCVNAGEAFNQGSSNVTCATLLAWQRAVQTAHDQFQAWLTGTHWADGRAAQQALNWLNGPLPASATQPSWFHQVQNDLGNTISQHCTTGGGSPIQLPGGFTIGSNVLYLGAAGLVAYMLLK